LKAVNREKLSGILATMASFCESTGDTVAAVMLTGCSVVAAADAAKSEASEELSKALKIAAAAFEEAWSHTAQDTGDIKSAAVTFESHYFGEKSAGRFPSSEVILSVDRNPSQLAKVMLTHAEASNPHCYSPTPLNETNRRFLVDVLEYTFSKIFDDPTYTDLTKGAIYSEILSRLSAVQSEQKNTTEEVDRLNDEILKLKNRSDVVSLEAYQELAEKLGIAKEQVRALLERIYETEVHEDQYFLTLKKLGDEFIRLRENAAQNSGEGRELAELDDKVRESIEKGDLRNAERFLSDATVIDKDKISEDKQRLDQRMNNASRRREMLALAAHINGEYSLAAKYYIAAATELPADNHAQKIFLRASAITSLRKIVQATGDTLAYKDCVKLAKEEIDNARIEHAKPVADICVELAAAHLSMHEFDGDDSSLDDACSLIEKGLKIYEEEKLPRDWMAAQITLSAMWGSIAQQSLQPADFEVAIDGYHGILDVVVPAIDPDAFVEAKINLAMTLTALATRTRQAEVLRYAIKCADDALVVMGGGNQFNRMNALDGKGYAQSTLGDITRDSVLCAAAVDTHEDALRVAMLDPRKKEYIVNIKNNLAVAKYRLGVWAKDESTLQEAVALIEECAVTWSRSKLPVRWAHLQHTLGSINRNLADLTNEKLYFDTSATNYSDSLLEVDFENSGFGFVETVGAYAYAVLDAPSSTNTDYTSARKYLLQVLSIPGLDPKTLNEFRAIEKKIANVAGCH